LRSVIVPIASEIDWTAELNALPLFDPGGRPGTSHVVVVAPHPDDETLGAGGLIALLRQQDVAVKVVAVTDGENAYPGQSTQKSAELAVLRRAEQTSALAILGVSVEQIVRLCLPDSDIAAHQQALAERLSGLVDRDTHLIAPWLGDFHPDHEACGRAAKQVAQATGARLTSYFFWTWHRGTPATIKKLPLRRFCLENGAFRLKAEALACHRSQLTRAGEEPVLPERLLAPARRRYEVFASA
jgi:LmbE family N-acetylglucosaminyl deacetylase